MDTISKYFYAAYGKYITRFRALPLDMDMLRPVERRVLLTVHETARRQYTKSAKVVGSCIANYHPHADQPVYQTLVRYVVMGLVDGQGGFYSYGVQPLQPSAMRYTEVKENPVIGELLSLIDYAPKDVLEFAEEPIYIPSPIPIGLIGNRMNFGVSFHRTVYPTFTIQSLFERLFALLENKEKRIVPFVEGCKYTGNDEELDKLFSTGVCNLQFTAEHETKGKEVHVYGQPVVSWNPVLRCIEKNKASYKDLSTKSTHVIIPAKCKDALTQSIKASVVVVNHDGVPRTAGIDELLLLSFEGYKQALKRKLRHTVSNLRQQAKELEIIKKLKPEIKNLKSESDLRTISKSIKVDYNELKSVISKYSINRLITVQVDLSTVNKNIKENIERLHCIDDYAIESAVKVKDNLKPA